MARVSVIIVSDYGSGDEKGWQDLSIRERIIGLLSRGYLDRVRFEPGMLAYHAYDGWGMERDIRRHSGFATVTVRRIDPRIRGSWLQRMGVSSVPLFLIRRWLLSCGMLLRLSRHYGIPWTYARPLAKRVQLSTLVAGCGTHGQTDA